jgi:hypothetical protein
MVLDVLDRWLVTALTAAMDLDRRVLERLAGATDDVLLPAVDRTVRRGRRLLRAAQRRRR